MAYTSDKKPGALIAATVLANTDNVVVEQSGDVKRATLAQVEAKLFDAKTAVTAPAGTEVVVVRQTDNSLRQVALSNIVPALNITTGKIADGAVTDVKMGTISSAGKVLNSATTATSANTNNTIVARDGSGNFSATGITATTFTGTLAGNITGSAPTLTTGRTIALTGDVTGTTGSFNGSANVSAATTIANNAVTTAKIADANVTTAKIADAGVTTAKIADSNVTTAKIADSNVTTAKIADSNVTTAKIADSNVTTAKIADSNVTTAKIADAGVTSTKIADANVTAAKIADANVTTAKIADANVTAAKLASNAVETTKIADANVTTAKIANAAVTPAKLSQPLTLATAQNTTSGTSINFTGIPSWVKRITVIFNGVSSNGSSAHLIQLGTSLGVSTSGYLSYYTWTGSNGGSSGGSSFQGFVMNHGINSDIKYSHMVITLISGTTWVSSHSGGYTNGQISFSQSGGGNVTLSGTLDRIRLTTVNGTDTFDAGSVNIMYEG